MTTTRRSKRSLRSGGSVLDAPDSATKKSSKQRLEPRLEPVAVTAAKTDVDSVGDLNSSPIKQNQRTHRNELVLLLPRLDIDIPSYAASDCSSSPIKRKKTVAFSDEIMAPPSPRDGRLSVSSPLKSILKPLEAESDDSRVIWASEDDTNSERSPANPLFWHIGTIVQLSPGSPDLPQLVNGIVNVLQDQKFSRKFEVYAALNHLCKVNNSETLYKLLVISGDKSLRTAGSSVKSSPARPTHSGNHINSLCDYIRRDLIALEAELFKTTCSSPSIAFPSSISASGLSAASPDTTSKIDPFCTRIINQALKLMAFLMTDQELNNFISIDHARWFYLHSCEMTIKPTLSKTLVLSYLVILKDCKFTNKKKKQIFDPLVTSLSVTPGASAGAVGSKDIPEQMLYCLLNMKGFQSSSLVVEKFVAIKNLIINFPTMMSKNFSHWFPILIVNLCDLNSPLYTKIVAMGIQTLLECARNFIDNKNVIYLVKKFLSTTLPRELKSLCCDSPIVPSSQFVEDSESAGAGQILAFDFLVSNLEELIRNGQYKSSMDIWVAITLLTGGSVSDGSGYEAWSYLSKWLKVHKFCFNQQDNNAKVIALTSWKAIVYNICHADLDNLKSHHDILLIKEAGTALSNASNNPNGETALLNIIKPKIKLLLHPLLNVTSVESQREIVDTLHNLFLSILYTLLNPNTQTDKSIGTNTSKYIHIYWERIIQPILNNFYFKKELSNSYMNQLGVSILNRLLVPAQAVSNFNDLRCLSNEPVTLSDLNSLSSKWIFNKFDRIMQNLILIFKLEKLPVDSKLLLFTNFLNCIRFTTKKEIKPSPTTYDIIDNLPYVLSVLFNNNRLNYEQLYKLIINLNDAFGPSNLIGKGFEESNGSVYYALAKNMKLQQHNLTVQDIQDICGLIYTSIGDNLNLCFVYDLVKLDHQTVNELQYEDNKENKDPSQELIKIFDKPEFSVAKRISFKEFYQPVLNARRINKNSIYELKATSTILHLLESDFEQVCKRLMQDIVLVGADEFEKLCGILKVSKWSTQAFKYFIYLMHDAPHYHLKQMTLNLTISRWDESNSQDLFLEVVAYLIESRFNFELFNLKKSIMKKYSSLNVYFQTEFQKIWKEYLNTVLKNNNFVLLDDLLVSAFEVNIEVKPYVRNRWEKLPLLTEKWLRANSELYIERALLEKEKEKEKDKDVESKVEIEESVAEKEGVAFDECQASQKQLAPLESIEKTADSTINEETESPAKTPGKRGRTKKAKTPKKKAAKATKKDAAGEPANNNFDIHSFTAMLTAKLSTPTPKKEKVTKNSSREPETPTKGAEDEEIIESQSMKELLPDSIETSESLDVVQATGLNRLEEEENFDYNAYVKNEPEISISPELTGTMDEVLHSQGESLDRSAGIGKRKSPSLETEGSPVKKQKPEAPHIEVLESIIEIASLVSQGVEESIPIQDPHEVDADSLDEVISSLDNDTPVVETAANERTIEHIVSRIQAVSDKDISAMSLEDRYKLETDLLLFMLRVRSVKADNQS